MTNAINRCSCEALLMCSMTLGDMDYSTDIDKHEGESCHRDHELFICSFISKVL